MSEESRHPDNPNPFRLLRDVEKDIVLYLLSQHPEFERFKTEIASRKVQDMLDGGMGSMAFFGSRARSFGGILAEAEYMDEDNVPVLISAFSDNCGDLYEIDFWKADFSPLKRYPQAELLYNLKIFTD